MAYVALPGYRYDDSIDTEPVNAALQAITAQKNAIARQDLANAELQNKVTQQNIDNGFQARSADRGDKELVMRGDELKATNMRADRSYGLQEREFNATSARADREEKQKTAELYGTRAAAVDAMDDSDPAKAATWARVVANYRKDVGDHELSPEELDHRTGPKLMATAAGVPGAAKYDVKTVGSNLVAVDPRNPARNSVVFSDPSGGEKLPQGYSWGPVDPATGQKTLTPIKGGPGENLTDQASKDALFADRAIRANRVFDDVAPVDEQGNFTKYNPAARSNVMWPDDSMFNSAEWKHIQQAKEDFAAGVLRKDTGAAISQEEYKRIDRQYFPQPGDDARTLLQKKASRAAAAQGLRGASGRAFDIMFPNYDQTGGQGGQILDAAGVARNDGSKPGAAPQPRGAPSAPQQIYNPQTGEVRELRGGQYVTVKAANQ